MILQSLLIGCLLGLVYGLFFVIQQRRVFLDSTLINHKVALLTILLSTTRLAFFGISLFYILHLRSINLILMLLSFFTTVLCIITNKRVRPYERC